jgi:hypothetical protein
VCHALGSSQRLLKRQLSVSAPNESIAKQLFKSNVNTPSTLLKYCTLIDCGIQSSVLVLPTETIENICLLVDESDDLRSLTNVNRLFASIACHIYAVRLGIHVESTSSIIRIQGNSFQALSIWRRSRLFTRAQDKCLFCNISIDDPELANTQIRALRNFLSASFVDRPFCSVNLNSADSLSPSEILQFIQLIDNVGCRSASISSGFSNPEWFNSSSRCTHKLKLPTVSLSYLRSLDIDHHYLSPRQWSCLLPHVIGPNLEALYIRGQPTIQSLSKFLSRHSHITTLHFNSRWATHAQCIKSSGLPHKTLQMPRLSEMAGPPCHLHAALKCLSSVPDTLNIIMEPNFGMTYPQYVRSVLASVSLCGPHVHLEIHLPTRYTLDHKMSLNQSEMQALTTIVLPEVVSLEISFPSMSERYLLVCLFLCEI